MLMENTQSLQEITLGEMIKFAANQKGITLYRLAKETGRDKSALYTMLGNSKLRTTVLNELLRELQVDVVVELCGERFKLNTEKN